MFLVGGWSNRKVLNDVAARHATPWAPAGAHGWTMGIVTMAFWPWLAAEKRAFWEPKTLPPPAGW